MPESAVELTGSEVYGSSSRPKSSLWGKVSVVKPIEYDDRSYVAIRQLYRGTEIPVSSNLYCTEIVSTNSSLDIDVIEKGVVIAEVSKYPFQIAAKLQIPGKEVFDYDDYCITLGVINAIAATHELPEFNQQ